MAQHRVKRFFKIEFVDTLTKAQLRAIGLVAVRGVELEVALHQVAVQLAKIPSFSVHGDIVFNHLNPSLVLDIITTLARLDTRHVCKEEFKELTKIVARIREALDERNKTIHAWWVKGGTGTAKRGQRTRFNMRTRGSLRYFLKEMSASEIEGVAVHLATVRDELLEFFEKRLPPRRIRY